MITKTTEVIMTMTMTTTATMTTTTTTITTTTTTRARDAKMNCRGYGLSVRSGVGRGKAGRIMTKV